MRIAVLDLGSNSFSLLIADVTADSFCAVAREKDVLRLGDVVARRGRLERRDLDRAVLSAQRLAEAAHGSDLVIACATSAAREALNGDELVAAIEEATGLTVHVLSGEQEAELVFTGLREALDLGSEPAVGIDLGGGSLEVMVGCGEGPVWVGSLPLGALRLTAELVGYDPPSPDDLRRLRARVTAAVAGAAEEVAAHLPHRLVGCGGTVSDLVRAAAHSAGRPPRSGKPIDVSRTELLETHERLLSVPTAVRAREPGVQPRRADLLPAAAMALEAVLDLFGFDGITASPWGLREGVVLAAVGRGTLPLALTA